MGCKNITAKNQILDGVEYPTERAILGVVWPIGNLLQCMQQKESFKCQ